MSRRQFLKEALFVAAGLSVSEIFGRSPVEQVRQSHQWPQERSFCGLPDGGVSAVEEYAESTGFKHPMGLMKKCIQIRKVMNEFVPIDHINRVIPERNPARIYGVKRRAASQCAEVVPGLSG